MRPWRVFLSYTSDLGRHPADRSFVTAAQAAVIRAGHAPSDMTYFAARDVEPADHCREAVAQADVFVGLIGLRYGSSVPGWSTMSYTELEFETATATGLPRLIFLLRPEAAAPPSGSAPDARQEAFRQRLRDAPMLVGWVSSPADLELGLYQALVELGTAAYPRVPQWQDRASQLGTHSTPGSSPGPLTGSVDHASCRLGPSRGRGRARRAT